jgi:hypothetical protein
MNLFGLSRRCRCRYYDVVGISTGVSLAGTYVYSANGMYDPDVTGTGHQPMGWDQMMLSFEHYCVLNATMTVTVRHTSTAQSAAFAIVQYAGATAITDFTRVVENGLLVRNRLNATPYDGSIQTFKSRMDVAKFGGLPDILDNPDYKGDLSNNPAEQSYFHLSFWNPDSVSVGTCICEVQIDYDVVFTEPRKLTLSISDHLKNLLISESLNDQDSKCSPPPRCTTRKQELVSVARRAPKN